MQNASIAEIMGNAGYDWVVVDQEHGSISHDQHRKYLTTCSFS